MLAYNDSQIPNVDFSIPRHAEEYLWSSINVRLDVTRLSRGSKSSLTKITQNRPAMLLRSSEVPRRIDHSIPGDLPRAGIGFLLLLEIGQYGNVVNPKHDILFLYV